jgi:osmotically inducible protein OsmC
MADIKRSGKAVWSGDLRRGSGWISVESGAFKGEPYGFGTRFEDEPGTNPEELIAAAHAACYGMAFSAALSERGFEPARIETHATCSLSPQNGGGFAITRMHLRVRGQVPNIDENTFRQVAEQADHECPVSNLLRKGLQIELDAALE